MKKEGKDIIEVTGEQRSGMTGRTSQADRDARANRKHYRVGFTWGESLSFAWFILMDVLLPFLWFYISLPFVIVGETNRGVVDTMSGFPVWLKVIAYIPLFVIVGGIALKVAFFTGEEE